MNEHSHESDELLDERERAIVQEEEQLLAAARAAIAGADHRFREDGVRQRMAALRRDLATALPEDHAAIAAEAQRVRETAKVRRRSRLPDLALPYFAHMQLSIGGRSRDVFLGQNTFIEPKERVTIIDWRDAPIAQVFFHYAEGEEYEQEVPDRTIEGVLTKRRILTFDEGQLVRIQSPEHNLRRNGEGQWVRDRRGGQPRLEGGEGGALAKQIIGTGQSGEKLPVISSLLDEQQYQALTLDPERPLLILGGAGCGKTTVALHRLAYLAYQDPRTFRPSKMAVIVPEEGLVRLTQTLLEELEMAGVSVATVDEWFAKHAKRLLPELPTKLARSTPPDVMRLKRHPALGNLLESIALTAARACAAEIDRRLRSDIEFRSHFEESLEPYPLQRLEAALTRFQDSRAGTHKESVRSVFDEEIENFLDPRRDRERVLGNRSVVEQIVHNAHEELLPGTVDRVIDRFRLQESAAAEEEFADVDVDRRSAVDGLSLDEGTPTEDAGSIDVEDFAWLLELHRLKTGRALFTGRRPGPYSHLVLDEAQELSEIELAVLGHSVATHGSITVAGDAAQQTGEGTEFRGWERTMEALGHGSASPVTLTTSYRCTRPIVEFGRAVLGSESPDDAPTIAKEGAPVSMSRLSTEMHAAIVLGDALNELLAREPSARVAIIAREDETALRLYEALRQHLPLRLVLDGRFPFRPGIDITAVPQVKGLEFDYVVIPDASNVTYPANPTARRMLHVAATRAIHQLWVLTTGRWSPLVPEPEDTPAPA